MPEPTDRRPDDGTARRGPADEPEALYVERNDDEWHDAELPDTVPSGATLEADRLDAVAAAGPGPIDPDAADKAPSGPVPPSVREAAIAAAERGAKVRGEGQILSDPDPAPHPDHP
jgi:hypothetical protein